MAFLKDVADSDSSAVLVIEYWNLGFICNLVLVF